MADKPNDQRATEMMAKLNQMNKWLAIEYPEHFEPKNMLDIRLLAVAAVSFGIRALHMTGMPHKELDALLLQTSLEARGQAEHLNDMLGEAFAEALGVVAKKASRRSDDAEALTRQLADALRRARADAAKGEAGK